MVVRLGNSGLKVSKIILGCMSYGHPGWQKWVLGEDEAIEQIKYACVARSLGHQSGRSCMMLMRSAAGTKQASRRSTLPTCVSASTCGKRMH